MASTYLTRNMTTQGSSIKGTFSCWFKLADDNLTGGFLSHYFSSSYLFDICMQSGHIEVADYRTAYILRKRTTAKYRDLNAWYHLYVAIDRSLATASDRCKIYVNGERVTDFQSSEDQDYSQQTSGGHTGNISMNNNYTARVGVRFDSTYFDGSISHMHWVDGSVIDISQFGSTDITTGEWKINTSPTVADYGTNGFFILKDGNSVTDQSGNSNNLTVSAGTLTNTEDCPSNVFATLNPLYNQTGGQGVVLANGNTRSSYSPDSSRSSFGTIAVGTGKFYFEAKLNTAGTAPVVGVVDLAWSDINGASGYGYHDNALNFGYNSSGQKTSGGTNTAYGDSYTAGDIIGVAIDKTNNKLYFAKNGVWQNSSDPTSGSTGTGSAYNLASDTLYTSACRMRNGGDWSFNFGNGFFGTTAISSEGTNASGIGKFEYDVPTGYTALSTKGLNE